MRYRVEQGLDVPTNEWSVGCEVNYLHNSNVKPPTLNLSNKTARSSNLLKVYDAKEKS